MRAQKKPIVIEYVEFRGFVNGNSSFSERPEWLLKAIYDDDKLRFFDEKDTLTIETLEGTMTANIGDYIIKGVHGELYPCKPDIFKQTYDLLD
ncbi:MULTISPECIES: hypothetical protein [Lactiplantibacillus]|uniref:hypothetical protein n=1 Tax=Lactiplantibacillus TaxID=2767842 RepID=UPI000B6173BE|nr:MULTISPECIES: hypothetical protein [Lactiplantibacillus]ASL38894.1 hypothetical protein CBI37_16180 [Lactiplantibacillus plantarum]MCG0798431.1 prophage P2a protein 33 [Lactiplantibacillus plantarum]MCM8654659.1 hypothetical protein [Lactiplantibacillus sp. C232]MDB7778927.1 hypothetical protein [Lactiplantibacillus plantarum]MDB7787904.1 hypothetical protein [Lactiplantibacillus plantarum]